MHKFCFAALTALITSLAAAAAPLTAPTAVHSQPDTKAPVISVLAPGTEPQPAPEAMATTPAGWMAVQQSGPFEGYVLNRDIDKALNVKPGASVHFHPTAESGVIATMNSGDKATITGLHGKWSQIRLEKPITGYIHVESTASAATTPPRLRDMPAAVTMPSAPVNAPEASSPASFAAPSATPAFASNDNAGVLPRLFQGKFVSTRRPFTPRRPYDWQLNDDAGVRYAYLDISQLLLTDQIDNFTGHDVVVYGTPKAMPDGKNIVIQIESLRLK